MGEGAGELARLVEDELVQPASAAAEALAAEIQRRHGPSLVAVIFYGSCLRRDTTEGVLDFYALVDAYASAYGSRALAWANGMLPPNVFYLEIESGGETLRSKYAVMSLRDFERATGSKSLRTGTWARFCQPIRAAYLRDAGAKEALVRGCVRSVLTAVGTVVPLLGDEEASRGLDLEQLWQRVFRETYAGEMRPESPESIHALYASAPERFDRAALCALAELDGATWHHRVGEGRKISFVRDGLRWPRLVWRLRRPLIKLIYAAQLFKSATTFGDWLPYVLWKLERHTGRRVVPTPRQRRHPFIWGWPLLFQVLRRRDLR